MVSEKSPFYAPIIAVQQQQQKSEQILTDWKKNRKSN